MKYSMSPFPGMDPYLEKPNLWSDVHLTLIIAMRGALNASLPQGYIAAADKYVWIHEPDADARTRVVKPDAFIVQNRERADTSTPEMTSAPTMVILPATRRQGNKYLKIMDSRSRRWITMIELLSPSNKQPGPDREDYLTKRMDYLTAGVNLVEIDLHRAGQRLPLAQPEASVPLNLRPCLEWAYEQGKYGEEVDYTRPPLPPLSDSAAAWAEQLLASKT